MPRLSLHKVVEHSITLLINTYLEMIWVGKELKHSEDGLGPHAGLVRDRSRLMDISALRGRLAAHQAPTTSLSLSNRISQSSQLCDAAPGLASPRANCNVLSDFVESSQPWTRERVPLPRRLRWTLWSMIPLELFWAIWLATIITGATGATSCDGPICTIATLNHHAAALLACGVFSIAGLTGLIPTTRGFAKCNGIEVIGVAIVSAAGGAALLGVAALVIGALIVLALIATFVLATNRNV
jgi:hypothetical protein